MPRGAKLKLSAKQKEYCKKRAEGKSYAEAYREAYDAKGNTSSCKTNAYHLENSWKISEKIQAEIRRLQKQAEAGAILKRAERQALLTEIATNPENDMPDRLRSLDQLNRMSGDYTDNVRTQVSGKVEMTFEERIAAIKADMENETS